MPREYLDKVVQAGQRVNPLLAWMEMEAVSVSEREALFRLPGRPGFIQGAGVVAGGIQATLLDEAMAHVVLANLKPGEATATVDLHVRYLRPVARGAMLCRAEVVRKGRTVIVVRAELSTEDGEVASLGTASFLVKKLDAEGGGG